MTCDAQMPGGGSCQREEGHDGPHSITVPIPADVGAIIEGTISAYEQATVHAERTRRSALRARTMYYLGFAACMGALVVQAVSVATH